MTIATSWETVENDRKRERSSSPSMPRRTKRRRNKSKKKDNDGKTDRPSKIPEGARRKDDRPGDKRIPEAEWAKIQAAAQKVKGAKRCHFFNSSMGCMMGDKCRFKHVCMVCGQGHPMAGNH